MKSGSSRLEQLLLICAFSGMLASPSGAQATSQKRIPLRKDTRRVDTVWVHDTVTITRVDTLRLTAAAVDPFTLLRVDTLVRVDTTKDCRNLFLPIPIPIPFGHTAHHDNPGSPSVPPSSPSVAVAPEPTTIMMVGAGLLTVGLIARRKKSKKDPPV